MSVLKNSLLLYVCMLLANGYSLGCKNEILPDALEENIPVKQENIWIFIMAGQSNMAGRGTIESQDTITNKRILTINSDNNWIVAREPLHFYEPALKGLDCGMSFALELLKHIPDSITIALVPSAVGGSSVFQWLNDEQHRGVNLLSNFKEKVQLSQNKGVVKGVLWHQGESNANKADLPVYKDALLKLFVRFRKYIDNDELPIILGELGKFAIPEEKAGNFEEVNKVIRNLASEYEFIHYVLSDGLDHLGDHLHFNSAAQRELGKRYARKYLEICQRTK
jgi:hypothetical protein